MQPYKQQPGNLMFCSSQSIGKPYKFTIMSDTNNMGISENGGQLLNLKRTHEQAGLNTTVTELPDGYSDDDIESCDGSTGRPGTPGPKPGKKTRGRVKINMEFIDNKLRRYTTFSKRKSGIMKKAHELATLTGTQVMLLVASETGHVYTFATRKLQPILSSEAGKQLIQTCLNSPDPPESTVSQNNYDEQRMSAQGFEEPDLSYAPAEETKDGLLQKTYHNMLSALQTAPQTAGSSQQSTMAHSTTVSATHSHPSAQEQSPMNLIAMNNSSPNSGRGQQLAIHLPAGTAYTIMPGSTQQDTRTVQLSSDAQSMMRVSSTQSASNVLAPPTLVHQPGLMQERLNESHIALLSPYNTIQRQVPAVAQQVLWAPTLATQPIAVMHSPPQTEEKKKS